MFTGLPKQVFFKIFKLSANRLNMNRQCVRYALVCTENVNKCLSSFIKSSLPTDFQENKEYTMWSRMRTIPKFNYYLQDVYY